MPFSKHSLHLISLGDEKKFRCLMEFISDDLLLFAIGFIRKREIAEEIVSDVFVKIWENRSNLTEIENLKAYLFISVKNLCISHIRKNRKENLITLDGFNDFIVPSVECPESDFINAEKLNEIYLAIEQLPPKCKMAFSLAKFSGLKYKEIAEIMEVSEKTVNNHLVFALKKLAETIGFRKKRQSKSSPIKQASLYSF
ncbi:MAG: RNA polymerase sigma-70 factor [Mariniphaga sp.]|nr:RNA polymerase sigma-70 factor [Mariniphaga sp.]